MRFVASRVLAFACLVCALLPLLHVAGDIPRGFEIRPVLASSSRLPVSDAGNRAATTAFDADDLHEDVVPPHATRLAMRAVDRPALPRLIGAFRTRAGAPLDRPPRTTAAG